VIVTAAHDGLEISRLDASRDLRLRSYPTGVWRSAMEVRTDVAQLTTEGEEEHMGQVFTVMVAREFDESGELRAARLPPLAVDGDAEAEARQEKATSNQARRKLLAKGALKHAPPTPQEVPVVHARCSDGSDGRLGAIEVAMGSTLISASQIMQMNHRNIHGNMFGGYLMRKAFELAYICAARFNSDSRPEFVGFDDVFFRKPVNVGDFWTYTALVVFAGAGAIRVRVEAHIEDVVADSEEATNEFFFVFRPSEQAKQLRIVPHTYEEAMLWLEGRRRWLDQSS